MKKLVRNFYNRDSITVAKDLLGKVLVYKISGKEYKGIIVEVEAYYGVNDKAAHSYGGKRTPRMEVMYAEPGFSYIYLIYGMYNCFNIVVAENGNPQAVLVRALQPINCLEEMSQNRYRKDYKDLNKKQIIGLTNGPGKLCIAMDIDRKLNGEDLCGDILYIEEENSKDFEIIESKRIGIGYSEEAQHYLWRYYIKDNTFVSKK